MDDPRQPSLEARESGENTENPEQQRLDDATFEPRSMVEQTGDYRQAESIQNNLGALAENAKPAEETVTAVPPHVPGEADRSKVTASPGEDEGDTVDAIPITVPDVRTAADENSSLPLPIPGEKTGPALISENDIRPGKEKTGPALIPENDIRPYAGPAGAVEGKTIDSKPSMDPDPIVRTGSSSVDQTSSATDRPQQPQERIVFTKPGVLPGGMDQQRSSLGHLDGPSGAVKAIADFISGGGRSGMDGDPFAHGGPLPGGANEKGGFVNEGGIPSNPLGKASEEIGEMLDFVNRHPGGEDPGKTGGGPGSINPKYGRSQASDTASDVQNEFMNYCKKAYDSGDTPKGRDVQPWIAGKAAEFFGEKLGKDEPLVGVLKEMSTQTETPTTTTVTRSTDASSSQGTSTTGVPQEVDPEDPPTMGHPDGSVGDGQKGPVTADDIDKSKAAGTFVKDPAYDQGGSSDSALLGTKHPGQITDYGYEGGKPPSDGGIRTVRDQLTDPPETAAGELSSLDQAVALLSVRLQDLLNNEKSNSGQQSSEIKKKSDQTQEDVIAKMK
jgi:hypothetical protein